MNAHFSLKIIANSTGYCAIEKPIGTETSFLLSTKFLSFSPVYSLDRELSGIVLCAKNKQSYNSLRNIYGSAKMVFNFIILAQNNDNLPDEITCDLPIAKHREYGHMIISHTTGKKSRTIFKKIKILKQFTLWSVEMDFLRKHQARLHAHEVGIKILGEDVYNKIPIPILSNFKQTVKLNRKGILMPLYPAVCIYLSEINFPYDGNNVKITSPLPSKFTAMLKIIQKWN
ncbi:MAG: hypothetical protein LBH08_03870 [Puniceicoccales bacterium]|nr:hypothetical protein [Puniceicoccales bacterium]